MVELYVVVRLFLVAGQWMYWTWVLDEGQDDRVWQACLHPGVIAMPERTERQEFWTGFVIGLVAGIMAGITVAGFLLIK